MTKPKILMFSEFPNKTRGITGASMGNQITANLLKEKFLVTTLDTGSDVFNPHDFGIELVTYTLKMIHNYYEKFLMLKKELNKDEYDYLYFLPGSSLKGHLRDMITVLISHKRVNKIVVHNRNGDIYKIFNRFWLKNITNWYIKKIDSFIFLSKGLYELNQTKIPSNKVSIVNNVIDDNLIVTDSEYQLKRELRKQSRTLKVLFLGNMIKSKGFEDLVEAAVLLKEEGFYKFEILIIGRWTSKQQKNNLQEYINKNNLKEYCTLMDNIVDREVVKQYYINSDIFVLPTYYPIEAQPRSIIEALNAGTPIITTHHASIPEMVSHHKEAIIVNKKDPHSISKAIKSLESLEFWNQLSLNCRKTFQDKFSVESVKHQLYKAFES